MSQASDNSICVNCPYGLVEKHVISEHSTLVPVADKLENEVKTSSPISTENGKTETVSASRRIALSGHCDNANHSNCPYPDRCCCSCHVPPAESHLTAELWYTKGGSLPFAVTLERAELFDMSDIQGQYLFATEKEAINEARKHAIIIEQRWRNTINSLDERYDRLEDKEMKAQDQEAFDRR